MLAQHDTIQPSRYPGASWTSNCDQMKSTQSAGTNSSDIDRRRYFVPTLSPLPPPPPVNAERGAARRASRGIQNALKSHRQAARMTREDV